MKSISIRMINPFLASQSILAHRRSPAYIEDSQLPSHIPPALGNEAVSEAVCRSAVICSDSKHVSILNIQIVQKARWKYFLWMAVIFKWIKIALGDRLRQWACGRSIGSCTEPEGSASGLFILGTRGKEAWEYTFQEAAQLFPTVLCTMCHCTKHTGSIPPRAEAVQSCAQAPGSTPSPFSFPVMVG